MNLLSYFHLPLATMLSLVTSIAIPYLSALATKAPSWATGLCTAVLSTASAFFSTWAAQGAGFNWKSALGVMFANFVISAVTHDFWLKGTEPEKWLYAHGNAGPVA